MTADIFLSYAVEDRQRASALAALLERAGRTVWWDQRIPAGSAWRSAIATALGNTRCLVVLWSRNSVESPWVNEEAEQARRAGKLIPILLDPIAPPLGFGEVQCADLSRWDGRATAPAFRRLLRDIEALAGPPGSAAEGTAPAGAEPASDASPASRRPASTRPTLLLVALGLLVAGAVAAAWALWPAAESGRPAAVGPGVSTPAPVSAPASAPVVEPSAAPSPVPAAVPAAVPGGKADLVAPAEPPRPVAAPAPKIVPLPPRDATGDPPRATRQEPAATGAAQARSERGTSPPPPPRCGVLLGRLQLGEALSDEDRAYLQRECRR